MLKMFEKINDYVPPMTITPTAPTMTGQNIPAWAYGFTVNRSHAQEFSRQTLADFFLAVMRETVEKAIDWTLAQDAGQNKDQNSVYPMRFDELANGADALKAELAKTPGVLFAAKTASGQSVIALFACEKDQGGAAVADWISKEIKAKGIDCKTSHGQGVNTGLHELSDKAPFIAQTLAVLGKNHGLQALENSNAQKAIRLWANYYEPTFETALTAIYGASLCAYVACRYCFQKPFIAACDVQIMGKSGQGKTLGRVRPLERFAERYHVREIGGLRTTDAACYDDFIYAAFNEQEDKNGKLIALTPKTTPDRLTTILDESGDTEKSRTGNTNKVQQNIIRRCAIFDGCIKSGKTAEQNKRYNGKLPNSIPTRYSMYRTCTENQIDAALDDAESGNARRVLYARTKYVDTSYMLWDEELEVLRRNILSDENETKLCAIYDYINERYNGETPVVFTLADDDETKAAITAAKIAFSALEIPANCFRTTLLNTATWLAVLRNGANNDDSLEIGANEITTACAICLNSFDILRDIENKTIISAGGLARTETQKQNQLLAYIGNQKNKCADKRYIERYLGKDFITLAKSLVERGVLIETTTNKHKAFRIPTQDEQERLADEHEALEGANVQDTKKQSVWDGNSNQGAPKQNTQQSKDAQTCVDPAKLIQCLDDDAESLQKEGMTGERLISAMRDRIKDNSVYKKSPEIVKAWLDDFAQKHGNQGADV